MKAQHTNSNKPLSLNADYNDKVSKKSIFFVVFLHSIAFCFGLWVFFEFTLIPVSKWWEKQTWDTVSCTIVSSQLGTKQDVTGEWIDVLTVQYAYHYPNAEEGDYYTKEYVGRVFDTGLAREYTPGTVKSCYVNPNNPAQAVLSRKFNIRHIYGLLGLLWIGLFVASCIVCLIDAKQKRAGKYHPKNAVPGVKQQPESLRPVQSKMLFFATYASLAIGYGAGLAIMYGIIFSVYGLTNISLVIYFIIAFIPWIYIAWCAIYYLMVLYNPRINATLNPGSVVVGDSAELSWDITGKINWIKKLEIYLVGAESFGKIIYEKDNAMYDEFQKTLLIESEDITIISRGRCVVEIPDKTMHSFSMNSRNIRWTVLFHGETGYWPEIKEHFEIKVTPKECKAEEAPFLLTTLK